MGCHPLWVYRDCSSDGHTSRPALRHSRDKSSFMRRVNSWSTMSLACCPQLDTALLLFFVLHSFIQQIFTLDVVQDNQGHFHSACVLFPASAWKRLHCPRPRIVLCVLPGGRGQGRLEQTQHLGTPGPELPFQRPSREAGAAAGLPLVSTREGELEQAALRSLTHSLSPSLTVFLSAVCLLH